MAPPIAITVVIHGVFKFCNTLARLSPNIKCGAPRGGCCMFIAGIQGDLLKHARIFVSTLPISSIVPLGAVIPEPGSPAGHESASGFQQLLHGSFPDWITQVFTWIRDCHSTGSSWDLHFRCLT